MPKRVAKAQKVPAEKKANSKQIKKDAKSEGRKDVIDQAVVDGKQKTHYILMLDDSGSMSGKPF